jgi:hypothetical protein
MPSFKKYDIIPQVLGGANLLKEEARTLLASG